MFAELLAAALVSAWAQSTPAPAQSPVAVPVTTPGLATAEELDRLRSQLPEFSVGPELVGESEIAGGGDYPKAAIANNEQGTARVRLLIGADGRVQRCGIAESSGSAVLDTQTCDLFIANARFKPARNKSGQAVPSIYDRAMVWRLEDSEPFIVRNQVGRESFILGPAGEMRSCKRQFRIAAGKWVEGH